MIDEITLEQLNIARDRTNAAIARLEQTQTVPQNVRAFIFVHELQHAQRPASAASYNLAVDYSINAALMEIDP